MWVVKISLDKLFVVVDFNGESSSIISFDAATSRSEASHMLKVIKKELESEGSECDLSIKTIAEFYD